ncbi:MAG: redoxin domain-containing protein [Deltaproteobacteria bacterium]|nr:redoxin domain-containing protein [Deltaproteobacteria bacterium]
MRRAIFLVLIFMTATCCSEQKTAKAPSAPPPAPKLAPKPAPPPIDAGTGSEATMLSSGKPTLLEFTRDHCLPCQIMAPWVAAIRKKYAGLNVLEINVDRPENKTLQKFFKVRSIPSQVYLDARGGVVQSHIGLATLEEMENALKKVGLLPDTNSAR